jgi:hypothetical protein
MNTAKHDAVANMAHPTPAESAAVLKRDLPDNVDGYGHVARKGKNHIRVGSVGQLIKIAMLRVKNALPF